MVGYQNSLSRSNLSLLVLDENICLCLICLRLKNKFRVCCCRSSQKQTELHTRKKELLFSLTSDHQPLQSIPGQTRHGVKFCKMSPPGLDWRHRFSNVSWKSCHRNKTGKNWRIYVWVSVFFSFLFLRPTVSFCHQSLHGKVCSNWYIFDIFRIMNFSNWNFSFKLRFFDIFRITNFSNWNFIVRIFRILRIFLFRIFRINQIGLGEVRSE